MKNFIYYIILPFLFILGACENDTDSLPSMPEPETPDSPVEFTLFMYMPWSQNLTPDLQHNLTEMQAALGKEHFPDKRVVSFISTSSTQAQMVEITAGQRKILKNYESPDLTTSQGIASILEDVKTLAPAQHYAMTIGCHGSGWLPVGALNIDRTVSLHSFCIPVSNHPVTRYFGGIDIQWQTDVSALVNAIESARIHLDFLLFDACYMGGVETAYELRHVADITVLSPTEIMGRGIPYGSVGTLLLQDDIDWQQFCNKYYDFFSSYSSPYATLSVIDSQYLEQLADAMRQLNNNSTWNPELTSQLQSFGGYYGENIFFDLGQYADFLSENGYDVSHFTSILHQSVIASVHTEYCYVYLYGLIPIRHYSGLSTSAPSTSQVTASWESTRWAIDTKKQ